MFVPPSFEPNTPCEPQWFPRPITDSIESSVDLLERLEEDRKRRLTGIANVAAITPIGLGGCEDRHGGSANHSSPKPKSGNNNDYSKYRYYPPVEDVAASLHTSYQKNERFSNVSSRQPKVGQRNYKRGNKSSTTPRSTTSSSSAAATTPASNDRAFNMDNSRLHSSRIVRSANNNTSTGESTTSPFMSPRLDPRAGGGYSSSFTAGYNSTAGRSGRTISHYQRRQSPEEISTSYTINTAATPTAGEEEYVTPPAMSATEQLQTDGHGVSDDVYSQRREVSQRTRRRRGWGEINV